MIHKKNKSIEETRCFASVAKKVIGAFASIALLLSLTMCETDYCNENMYVAGTMKAFFKKSKQQINGVNLARMTDDGDTIFMTKTNGACADFPLNPLSDTSRFSLFTPDSFLIRNIAIVYSNKSEFINAECGIRTVNTIDTVIIENPTEGDSVAIKMEDVDENYDNENIEIYLAGFE